ncbi:MAG: MFS transporter [Acidimicrobiia bacterium]|nr:MFS transporter [Acidimicrobiia bacterium]
MPPSAKRRRRGNVWPIVAGQTISLLGDYIAFLALPLFVLDLTGRGADLGFTVFFETLPVLLFGFAAGVALDRISIRRALVAADLGRGAAFALLSMTVVTEVPHVVTVFAVAFMVGSLGVLFDSGLQAWLPALLPDDQLVAVNSRLQFARTATWTIGPPLANFLIAAGGGFAVAFGVNALTFVFSAAFVLMLVETRPRPVVEHDPWWDSFRDGIRYLWRQPVLRAATGAAMVWNLTFVPMEALLVLFATALLDIPSNMVGWFFGGHALLGAAGVALAPRLTRIVGLGRTFVLGMAMLGGGFLTLALAAQWVAGFGPWVSVALATLPAGIAVAGVSLANVAFFTLRQQIPPQEMLGRVVAASRTLAWAGIPFAAAVGGALGDAVGVKPVYLGASAILLIVAALLTRTDLWRHRAEMDSVAAGPESG